jgi:UDP-4-amino-4,6-dideoxy-N-acetyl-beta-L-altrosamine transaminase
MIPYGKQEILTEDIQAVEKVLKADFLTQGPEVHSFEKNFADYIGSKYAVAVSNGTAALHLSTLALGISQGKKVITSPITFVASANSILYAGGEVCFCDIDPETLSLDIHKVRALLERSKEGAFAGIIPVNFAGYPLNLAPFRKLADEYGLWLLEDSCHAPGGFYHDDSNTKQSCGNGQYADLAIFSFHPVKHIASGEGGMVTTNNENLYNILLQLRTHGITKQKEDLKKNEGGWYYEMQSLGYNYRLPDILCALGNSQLKRAKDNVEKRRELAKRYLKAFENTNIIISKANFSPGHAFHLFVIQVDCRKELYEHLKSLDIFAQVHYIPVHKQPYYIERYGDQNFPIAEEYYQKCLSLPMYPSLSFDEQDFVIQTILNFIKYKV